LHDTRDQNEGGRRGKNSIIQLRRLGSTGGTKEILVKSAALGQKEGERKDAPTIRPHVHLKMMGPRKKGEEGTFACFGVIHDLK